MSNNPQPPVHELADQLAQGFDALYWEYQLLFNQHRRLETKLTYTKQQVLDSLKRFTPHTLSQDHLVFLQTLEQVGSQPAQTQLDWAGQLENVDDEDRRSRASLIRQAESATASLRAPTAENAVKIWSGPSADKQRSPLRIISKPAVSPIEKDFTTTGTPSRLGCPFASKSGKSPLATPRSSNSRMSFMARRSRRQSFNDPIRAEICGNYAGSGSASIEGSAAVCPIRFLDQHAPEDVAKYFEKHKHELPRSHEVCVSRFQSNAESIEQLDRKYGNLVSMIQGLGEKHQVWLPEEPDEVIEEEAKPGSHTEAKVQKWATAVSASLQHNSSPVEELGADHALEEGRTAHYDGPMKEIRVGESANHPWGITIPPKYTNGDSSSSVGSAPTASPRSPIKTGSPIGETPQKPTKCPFDHQAMGKTPKTEAPPHVAEPATKAKDNTDQEAPPTDRAQQTSPTQGHLPTVVPQMVFNGPVFLGYPPDQLISLLQNSNLGAAMR
ncbi:hypothetical protein BDV95DRAFT_631424 [Massariosphaeria phaeospora]|uniref:Uncharacterized protein n=1 Tax=Massariosphaeria phaeospora TaxID=100035 RepID=A0A7C8I8D4_9PLEO|nr:hypothetical protein BDV95DRAFT_631424 [Massariosphaeria phaeospora]